MEMIEKISERQLRGGQMRTMAIFKCPYCDLFVKKERYLGKKYKSCGCVEHKLRWDTRGRKLNEYLIKGDTVLLFLAFSQTAIIDLADFDLVKDYYWHLKTNGYIYNNQDTLLHKFLTGFKMTDHINGNPLDNRRANLRECTNQQNLFNRGRNKNNSSGYKGVIFRKDTNKWQSQIMINRKHISLGSFLDKEDAAKAYDKAARRIFGEFAQTNF